VLQNASGLIGLGKCDEPTWRHKQRLCGRPSRVLHGPFGRTRSHPSVQEVAYPTPACWLVVV